MPSEVPNSLRSIEKAVTTGGGIEPPPAFSGLLTDLAKWFRINASACSKETYRRPRLGPIRMIWAVFVRSMFPYCSRGFARFR
jgi:hypothetical protein